MSNHLLRPRTIVATIIAILLSNGSAFSAEPQTAAPLTVGFVYVGTPDDLGYNQAHAEGANAVKKLPGVMVVEADQVSETRECDRVMDDMIKNGGARMIFATSFGYLRPHVMELAIKNPNVTFLHPGGVLREGDPKNVGSYFGYTDEGEYLSGMAAGLTTKSNRLGFIAAKPIVPVLRNINSFVLGARSVNPKASVTVIFTGDWFSPVDESAAVSDLVDRGVDVVTGHVDSLKTILATAERRHIFSCGFHTDGSPAAPKGYLTGTQWDWGPLYEKFVADFRAGKPMPVNFMGGLSDGTVNLSPFGPAVSPATRKEVSDVLETMKAGKFQIFKGPLKDNKGNVVIPEDKSYDQRDPWLWTMNWQVEGVDERPKRRAVPLAMPPDLLKEFPGSDTKGMGPRGPVFDDGAGQARTIIFVCNASASMADKIPTLKNELEDSIGGFKPNQSFNIIFFQDGRYKALDKNEVVPGTSTAKRDARKFIEDISPIGDADPIAALTVAFRQHPQLIYLLTDTGFPDNKAVKEAIAELNHDHAVRIDTIEFVGKKDGDKEPVGVLQDIAKGSGGTYRRVAEGDLIK